MSTESDGYLSFGVGLVMGLGLGAALGILLAPKSGRALRSDLCKMAHDLPDNLNQSVDDTKDKCVNIFDKTKYAMEKHITQINEAFKAGKMAAAKKKEELEEGLTGC